MDMLKYYDIKEKYQSEFSKLENEMIKCFREVNTKKLKLINAQYENLLKKYKKLF